MSGLSLLYLAFNVFQAFEGQDCRSPADRLLFCVARPLLRVLLYPERPSSALSLSLPRSCAPALSCLCLLLSRHVQAAQLYSRRRCVRVTLSTSTFSLLTRDFPIFVCSHALFTGARWRGLTMKPTVVLAVLAGPLASPSSARSASSPAFLSGTLARSCCLTQRKKTPQRQPASSGWFNEQRANATSLYSSPNAEEEAAAEDARTPSLLFVGPRPVERSPASDGEQADSPAVGATSIADVTAAVAVAVAAFSYLALGPLDVASAATTAPGSVELVAQASTAAASVDVGAIFAKAGGLVVSCPAWLLGEVDCTAVNVQKPRLGLLWCIRSGRSLRAIRGCECVTQSFDFVFFRVCRGHTHG